MRSLIKSHRRSDSSASDAGPDPYNRPGVAKTTPINLPQISLSAANMTPPQTLLGSLTSILSPKKLLTPIKKMFGHHLKLQVSPGVVTTGDSLNAAMHSTFEPPRGRRNLMRGANSYTSLSDLQLSPIPRPNPLGKPLPTSVLMEIIRPTDLATQLPPPKLGILPGLSDSSVDTKSKEDMPIIFDRKLGLALSHTGESVLSIANSEGNFKAKQALSHELLADISSKDTEAYYEDDDELKDSDASSQFSFVKDIRGGRNTSVKYYKTKTSIKANAGLKPGLYDDMGYEGEALSDYDFENNGMDEDGLEEDYIDDFEGNNRYDDFLDEDQLPVDRKLSELPASESTPYHNESEDDREEVALDENIDGVEEVQLASSISKATESSDPLSESTHEPPQFSFSRSREATPEMQLAFTSQSFSSPGEGFTDELLDSYLDHTRLPNNTTTTPSSQRAFGRSPFETRGTSSPLINGVTFGSEQKFRLYRNNRKLQNQLADTSFDAGDLAPADVGLGIVPADPNNRESIANMMDLLGSLEKSTAAELPKPERRQSIVQMMDFLSSLQQTTTTEVQQNQPNGAKIEDMKSLFQELDKQKPKLEKPKAERSLVIDMMNTLADLESALDVPTEERKKKARSSIADMMKTLAALELDHSNDDRSTSELSNHTSASSERRVEESISRETSAESTKQKPEVSFSQSLEDVSTDQTNCQLDEDLLDEINQLPEDYDFEDQRSHIDVPDFFRSNSYNKKPQRVVMDNCFQKNKIETSLKTVTFYKSGCNGIADNLNRAGSLRSITSLNSFHEEEEEDEKERFKQKPLPYSIHHNSHLLEKSSDSISHKSFNLEPITEADSPIIK